MFTDPMRVRSTTTHCLQLLAFVFSAACGSDDTDKPTSSDPATGTSGASGSAPVAGTAAGSAGSGVGGRNAAGAAGTRSTTAGIGAGAPAAGTTGAAAGAVAAGSGAAAGAGGSVDPTAGAAGGGNTTPDVACNPADMLPEAMAVTGVGTGMPPAGKFPTAVEVDPGLPEMTVLRPETLGEIKHPVLAWGNGGCRRANSGFTEFLLQLAAEGVVVFADGSPATTSGSANQNGEDLIEAIDWAEKENERPCSKYYHKLDLKAIAVSGQSCGGLMALNTSDDPRVTMSMPMNSGLMARDQELYAALHAPMAIINGGSSDIAYENGNADFEAITNIPMMVANIDVGHGGTYREDNGGEMGKFAIAWVRWHLLHDEGATGKGMFIGDSCGFCNTEWEMMWKMKPM